MQKVLQCAIYTRVSTDNQAEKKFNSCESQEQRIRSFINSQEDMEVYNVYSDPGFTGANLERPALREMVNDVIQNKVSLVISYKIDRLTRSPKDFYQLIELFEKYNVDFISVTERFDTSTPSGRLLRNIMLTFAQFERELSSERTRDKMIQRAHKGMWNGGAVPYGYDAKDKRLVINEDEAGVIRTIYDRYVATASISTVYDELRKQDIRNRKGEYFSKSGIYHFLRNKIYSGIMKYKDIEVPGDQEPIVTKDIFEQAQKCHRIAKRKMRSYKDYLLPGMVKCAECGSVMTPCQSTKRTPKKAKKYYYYRCTSTFKHHWNACSTRQVNANRLEDYILQDLERFSQDTIGIDNLIFRLNTEKGNSLNREVKKFNMGVHSGLELTGECPDLDAKHFQKQLQFFIQSSAKSRGAERQLLIKKHVKNVLYSKEYIQVELYYYPPGYDISTQDIPEHNNLNESMLEKDYTGYVTNERRRVALGDVAGVDSASCAARGVSQCAAERVFLQLKKPDTHCEYPVGTNIMAPRVRLELTT